MKSEVLTVELFGLAGTLDGGDGCWSCETGVRLRSLVVIVY